MTRVWIIEEGDGSGNGNIVSVHASRPSDEAIVKSTEPPGLVREWLQCAPDFWEAGGFWLRVTQHEVNE